jgi:molecular chaperone DnaJ
MAIRRDYYEVLGVARDADVDTIKKAYRKLAMQYHPDRNPGDTAAEESFKEATEAWEVLHDPQKRAAYDRFGHDGLKGAGGFGSGMPFDLQDALRAFMQDFGGFGDIFGGAGGGERRGADMQVQLRLTLNEVATGVTRTLRIRKAVTCDTCAGTGAKPGTGVSTCRECQGQGQVRQVHRTFIGQFINVVTCPRCGGAGKTAESPCPDCRGDGRKRGEETLSIEVPPGVADGNYMTRRGHGEAGPHGAPAGDLAIVFRVEEHEIFQRHGNDLLAEFPLSAARAALGGEETVPTLDGEATVDVPSGVQTGRILRLKGKGLPVLNGRGTGDLLLRTVVFVPTRLSSKEKELYAELARIEEKKPPRPERGLFDKIREAFRV